MSFAPIPSIVPLHACETVTGRYVDVVNPRPEDINLTDMVWSVSRQVRYAGHTLGDPYHIAQHECFVEFLLDYVTSSDAEGDPLRASFDKWMSGLHWPSLLRLPIVRMHCLVHDNTEAYLVDLPSPVKRHPALREPYKELEENLKCVIELALGIPKATVAEERAVIWGDLMALQIESANLMPSRGRGWAGTFPDFDLRFMELMPKIVGWRRAQEEYVERYTELANDLGINGFVYAPA